MDVHIQSIQLVKHDLANNRFIAFETCDRLLVHSVTWKMYNRLRIFRAFGLMGIIPGSVKAAGDGSSFLWWYLVVASR